MSILKSNNENLVLNADGATSDVEIQSNGSTIVTVTDTGKLGLNVTSPNTHLHIDGGLSDTALAITNGATGSNATDGFNLTVENPSTDAVLRNRENSNMRFFTNNIERMRITSDGRGLSQFTAKAWVNFNGTGTVAIRDSHNISSIGDYGTGQYKVNFSNSFSNTDYSLASSSMASGVAAVVATADETSQRTVSATGSFYLLRLEGTFGAKLDPDTIQITAFGS